MTDAVAAIVHALLFVIEMAVLGRVLYSWVDPNPGSMNEIKQVLWFLTEPILGPLRQVIPPIGGMLDITPIIAFFILRLVQSAVPGGGSLSGF